MSDEMKKACFFCKRTEDDENVQFLIEARTEAKESEAVQIGIFMCAECGTRLSAEVNKAWGRRMPEFSVLKKRAEIQRRFFETLNSEEENDDEECMMLDEYEEEMLSEMEEQYASAKRKLSPREIKEIFDRNVIGQEEAKKALALAIYRHQIAMENDKIKKSNILLVGPSGSGKTLLAEQMAKVLNLPFVIADAPSFTKHGYTGGDVESMLYSLWSKAEGNMERAEKGIIFIDEIDKIARKKQEGNDVAGIEVQNDLLKLIEGTDATITLPGHMEAKFNTRNILFIFGGAFAELTHKKEDKNPLGFITDSKNVFLAESEEDDNEITPEMIMKYGFTPEFVGRIPVIVKLDELGEEDLVKILSETEDSLLDEFTTLFENDGASITFEKEALREIAHIAIDKGTGARGLRSIMEGTLHEALFECLGQNNNCSYIVTKDSVHTGQLWMKA